MNNSILILSALLLSATSFSCSSQEPDGAAATEDCCADKAQDAVDLADLPETSIYHLESDWQDQAGAATSLANFRDEVVVAVMIFTNCQFACPRILSDLKRMEALIEKDNLEKVRWLLISMDSERDHPEVLKAYAEKNNLPEDRWTLLHGDSSAVRGVAAALGVNYKEDSLGNYSHSNLITILDRTGQITHRTEGLNADVQPGADAVNSLAAQQ